MHRAGVAAAHRDDDVRPLGVRRRRASSARGRVELWHQLGDFGMHVLGGGRSGRTRLAAAPLVERLRHLRATRRSAVQTKRTFTRRALRAAAADRPPARAGSRPTSRARDDSTSPASRSTFRWCEIVGCESSKRLGEVADADLVRGRRGELTIATRVGSASALKRAASSSRSGTVSGSVRRAAADRGQNGN